jgi:hypothetical protein
MMAKRVGVPLFLAEWVEGRSKEGKGGRGVRLGARLTKSGGSPIGGYPLFEL